MYLAKSLICQSYVELNADSNTAKTVFDTMNIAKTIIYGKQVQELAE